MGHIQIYGSIPAMGKTPSGDRVKRFFADAEGRRQSSGVIVLEN